MTTKITIQDLINSLRQAASNPEAHAPAQLRYFSELKEDSVLVNCGTACCIAGDLMLKAHAGSSKQEIDEIIDYRSRPGCPGEWVTNKLGLTEVDATLAFDSNTHYRVHLLLADLLEAGLHFPDDVESVRLSSFSTYTDFDCAYLGVDDESYMSLEELLSWMCDNAR